MECRHFARIQRMPSTALQQAGLPAAASSCMHVHARCGDSANAHATCPSPQSRPRAERTACLCDQHAAGRGMGRHRCQRPAASVMVLQRRSLAVQPTPARPRPCAAPYVSQQAVKSAPPSGERRRAAQNHAPTDQRKAAAAGHRRQQRVQRQPACARGGHAAQQPARCMVLTCRVQAHAMTGAGLWPCLLAGAGRYGRYPLRHEHTVGA